MSSNAKGKRAIKSQDRLGRYYTPDAHADLVADEAFRGLDPDFMTVLDPSAGSGQLLAACLRIEPVMAVYGIDVDPVAPIFDYPVIVSHKGDFLDMEPGVEVPVADVVVMNPPYSIVEDDDVSREVATMHVREAIKWAKTRVVALMSVAFLGGLGRFQSFWKEDKTLRRIVFIPDRPSYTGGGTASSDYVILVFEPGERTGPIEFCWREARNADAV